MKLHNSQGYFITISRRLLKTDFVRFCIVGSFGFLVNLVFLTLFYRVFGITVFLAQLMGAEAALLSNLIWHHKWTYNHHKFKKSLSEIIIQFHLSSWTAIVGSAVFVSLAVSYLNMAYGLALAIASLLSLTWNYLWCKLVVWRHNDEPKIAVAN